MGLTTNWHSSVATPIPNNIDPKSVINVLHNHSFLITCSPIVTRHSIQNQSQQTSWINYEVFEVVDIIPFGIWKREISFNVCFQDKADGVVSFIEAPMGVVSEATYTVKQVKQEGEGEGESWILEEEIDSSCNGLLKSIVERNMMSARRKLHLQAIEAAGQKQKDEGQDAAPAS